MPDGAPAATPLVDARGLRCPWPALRLARVMRETEANGAGGAIAIVADDPAAPGELAALAAERGWRIAPAQTALGAGFIVFCADIPRRDQPSLYLPRA